MSISIFGLGYVGAVTAGCLARRGHRIVGVDLHPRKIEGLNQGKAPIVEPGLDGLLHEAASEQLLYGTQDSAEAVAATDLSIVCVGTPSRSSGALDLKAVEQVTDEIAAALRAHPKNHVLIFRSTMLPGSTRALVDRHLKDLVESERLEVFYYPEFLREGSAIRDFEDPALVVVGTRDGASPPGHLMKFFGVEASVVPWEAAEMVKYAANAFHATKITFANEIGRMGKKMGVDARMVMELLCEDTRLNISASYLRPGNPFGGSCLPKDLRALNHFARQGDVPIPMVEQLLTSNEQHLKGLIHLVQEAGHQEVVILGLSFKPDTDDLRESAMVELAQFLLGRGYHLRIFDPQLNLKQLVGTNKEMIETKMPHLASLLYSDLASAVGGGGTVVIAQRCASMGELRECITPRHHIVDVNGWLELEGLPASYEGLCW